MEISIFDRHTASIIIIIVIIIIMKPQGGDEPCGRLGMTPGWLHFAEGSLRALGIPPACSVSHGEGFSGPLKAENIFQKVTG